MSQRRYPWRSRNTSASSRAIDDGDDVCRQPKNADHDQNSEQLSKLGHRGYLPPSANLRLHCSHTMVAPTRGFRCRYTLCSQDSSAHFTLGFMGETPVRTTRRSGHARPSLALGISGPSFGVRRRHFTVPPFISRPRRCGHDRCSLNTMQACLVLRGGPSVSGVTSIHALICMFVGFQRCSALPVPLPVRF